MSRNDGLPIAPLRNELDTVPQQKDGEEFLLLHDTSGYSENMLLIAPHALLLCSLFDGKKSIEQVQDEFFASFGSRFDENQIHTLVDALDSNLFLNNDRFQRRREEVDAEYLSLPIRTAVYAGQSYPDNAQALRTFFDDLFREAPAITHPSLPVGIITPHIDLQIGPEVYVPGFQCLKNGEFDTIVILGTSHYSSEDMFLLTEKHFETPSGVLTTDVEFVRTMHAKSGDIFSKLDIAHRREHSIEFPALFIQYLFGNEKKIVPILSTSMEQYLIGNEQPMSSERYRIFLDAFRETIARLGRKVVFIVSVDWSHVGKKFGDNECAERILPVVRITDHQHFQALETCNYKRFYSLLRSSKNASRIDGFSCITTFFDLVKPTSGKLLAYDQWHEQERESGVTYASLVFYADSVSEFGRSNKT